MKPIPIDQSITTYGAGAYMGSTEGARRATGVEAMYGDRYFMLSTGESINPILPFLQKCKNDAICTGIWRPLRAKNAQISQVFWQADNLRNSPFIINRLIFVILN